MTTKVVYPVTVGYDPAWANTTTAETKPCEYRLGIRDGKLLLQGCFKSWTNSGATFFDWRDLPTVELSNASEPR